MFLLKDYTPSLYNIQQTQLSFLLNLEQTVVRSQLLFEITHEAFEIFKKTGFLPELILHGEDLEFLDIKIYTHHQTQLPPHNFKDYQDCQDWRDWHSLNSTEIVKYSDIDQCLNFNNPNFISLTRERDFRLENNLLILDSKVLMPYIQAENQKIILQIQNKISPIHNKTLMGMYASNGKIFTQCEAEGFRRITYYLDRPDQMSVFTVHIAADEGLPILLSNGNLIAQWQSECDRHTHHTIWHDPFKKPAYLFALVAGDLICYERKMIQQGQEKLLQIWVEADDIHKVEHAMNSLEKSIAWDMDIYGLPLDLDRFMIVATHDFNMGAMENKGLNIFNAKYILAHPDMATDIDYYNVESIIAHEYFHNWTGNRVTCRDWFQLTLKEGLTVFRDQSFSEDLQGKVTRLEGIQFLKQSQFAEDRGPMAHPIQPQAYEEINNFYTLTVYEKGAEMIRMYQTLLGKAGFMAGMKLYFERHDGQAVTCQDFLASMRDAYCSKYQGGNRLDNLNQQQWQNFSNWYTQKGTPVVTHEHHYDQQNMQLQIKLQQSIQSINYQPVEFSAPLCIPIAIDIYVQNETQTFILKHEDLLKVHQANSDLNTTKDDIRCIDDRFLLLLNDFLQSWQFDLSKIESLKNIKDIKSIKISYLQDFSAPVLLHTTHHEMDSAFILKYEKNLYQKQQAFIDIELQALKQLYLHVFEEDAASNAGGCIVDVVGVERRLNIHSSIKIQNAYQQLKNDMRFIQSLNVYQYALANLLNTDDALNSSSGLSDLIGDDFKALVVNGLTFAEFKAELMKPQNPQNPQNSQENSNQDASKNIDIQLAWQTFHIFKMLWLGDIYQKNINLDEKYRHLVLKIQADYQFKDNNQRSLAYAYLKAMTYIEVKNQNNQIYIEELATIYKNAKHLSQQLAALQTLILFNNLSHLNNLNDLNNLNSLNQNNILSQILEIFLNDFKHEPLVIDQWFKLQAMQYHTDEKITVDNIKQLMHSTYFSDTPNRVRALLLTFFTQNIAFYSQAGLELWMNVVLHYDAQNPQLAARFARSLDDWRNLNTDLQKIIQPLLNKALQAAKSSDVLEVLRKSAL